MVITTTTLRILRRYKYIGSEPITFEDLDGVRTISIGEHSYQVEQYNEADKTITNSRTPPIGLWKEI
ncbi:hypothetical protein FDI69_gp157 [Rhodococcus phage Trina]|uniref:Uncharacterized protein n=1 Tax=Rhodococcus phage Trina TaxID=2027905 RepID=A0A2D0ZN67_9CAUD|nr:hypothetical protein FDI69_gp157 [Rhodococcus phage Trina]ASZ75029.1 hypothetical protein SEA_TRINA_250 [Rhodococcus phage Trina]